MLSHISIKNFVLVDNISLDFKEGLSVITGESGAGKSILINAMGLVLGERASHSLVREGTDKIEINVLFDISRLNSAQKWLSERDLLSANDCILRRIITSGGASRAFINGTPVTLEDLKQLGSFLVSIQGQHAHQVLLHKQNHVSFIDDYGQIKEEANDYRKNYFILTTKKRELEEMLNLNKNDARTMDLLRHELEELNKIDFNTAEYIQLEEEHNRLNNSGDLLEDVRSCLSILEGGDSIEFDNDFGANTDGFNSNVAERTKPSQSVLSSLNEISSSLNSSKDKKLNDFSNTLSQADILLRELSKELQVYASKLNVDPFKLQELNNKMSEIHRLARKHNIAPESLGELHEQRKVEWDNLDKLDVLIQQKEDEISVLDKQCRKIALRLSEKRKDAAQKFNKEVAEQLAKLQMSCRFATKFTYNEQLGPVGDSSLEFLLSTSPSGHLMPLKNIASGGELSRAALAIGKLVARNSAVPVLVFDEADSGIGGKTASLVGQSLAELGLNAQIICITHQPQTAVYGDNHYAVFKRQNGKEMLSNIKTLNEKEKQQEIARMLSGESLGQDALNYAAKLLHQARLDEKVQTKPSV